VLNERQYPRAEVPGAIVTILWPAAAEGIRAVRNLSEGGMLVECDDVPLGHSLLFVLHGPGLGGWGRGHVAHRTNGATGIAVDHWNSPTDDVRAVVRRSAAAAAAPPDAYVPEWA
jgi:hypothetical protein